MRKLLLTVVLGFALPAIVQAAAYCPESIVQGAYCPESQFSVTTYPGGASFSATWTPYKGFAGSVEVHRGGFNREYDIENGGEVPLRGLRPGQYRARLWLVRDHDGTECVGSWVRFQVQ